MDATVNVGPRRTLIADRSTLVSVFRKLYQDGGGGKRLYQPYLSGCAAGPVHYCTPTASSGRDWYGDAATRTS